MSKLIDLINASDATEEQKTALSAEFGTYKTESNKKGELDRIKLENKLATEKLSVKNLTINNDSLKQELENAGANPDNIETKLKELQTQHDLKYNALQGKYDGVVTERDGFISDKKIASLTTFASDLLDGAVDFPGAAEMFAKGLYETATEGAYLAKDANGLEILPDTYRDNFIQTYSKYAPAPAANVGGSDTTTTGGASTGGLTKDSFEKMPMDQQAKLMEDSKNLETINSFYG